MSCNFPISSSDFLYSLEFRARFPNCTSGKPYQLSDGICNLDLYTEGCNFDGGDCDEFKSLYSNCTVEFSDWLGDGLCDGGEYNVLSCNWDGGDCIGKLALM